MSTLFNLATVAPDGLTPCLALVAILKLARSLTWLDVDSYVLAAVVTAWDFDRYQVALVITC
jgi:hypothetical protein